MCHRARANDVLLPVGLLTTFVPRSCATNDARTRRALVVSGRFQRGRRGRPRARLRWRLPVAPASSAHYGTKAHRPGRLNVDPGTIPPDLLSHPVVASRRTGPVESDQAYPGPLLLGGHPAGRRIGRVPVAARPERPGSGGGTRVAGAWLLWPSYYQHGFAESVTEYVPMHRLSGTSGLCARAIRHCRRGVPREGRRAAGSARGRGAWARWRRCLATLRNWQSGSRLTPSIRSRTLYVRIRLRLPDGAQTFGPGAVFSVWMTRSDPARPDDGVAAYEVGDRINTGVV